MNILSTSEAAERLGISTRRVIALIDEGKLAAKKVGRDYVIEEDALMTVTVYGKAGRPAQKAAKKNSRKVA